MAHEELSRRIGEAWNHQRQGSWQEAVKAFQALAREADRLERTSDTLHHLVDIYYGLGLAERGVGNKTAALEAFNKAAELATESFEQVRRADGSNDLNNEEDDRFMMLGTMIRQRIAEMS
jgi:tetratricopeptide (TPR) repeat protein